MTYVINNYNGSPLVSVPDRTVNITATSIKLPGRDYPRYGEPIVEDLVWMLQNFANTTPPLYPIDGQIWYNTTEKTLKVYDASTNTWLGTGKTAYGYSVPLNPSNGQLWFNTSKQQLYAYHGNVWKLIGPLGASDGEDAQAPAAIAYTDVQAIKCLDTGSNSHNVLRITVGGTVVAVVSSDTFSCLSGAIPGSDLTTVSRGINLTNASTINGTASNATTANNSTLFDNKPESQFFQTTKSNEPAADNQYELGSPAAKFANVYSTTFTGTATSAKYADLAERYHSDQPLSPGTVVMLGGEHEITKTTVAGSTDVFGVISHSPGFILNQDAGDDNEWPLVALAGRVTVKVTGAVRKGQRLMSSHIPGVAQEWDPAKGMLAIIGRSLEDKSSLHMDTVLMVAGVK